VQVSSASRQKRDITQFQKRVSSIPSLHIPVINK